MIRTTIIYVGRVRGLRRSAKSDGQIRIGAGVTYADAVRTLARHYPAIGELIRRIGSEQIRAERHRRRQHRQRLADRRHASRPDRGRRQALILRKAGERRVLPLEDFFLDYGRQDRSPGEIVEAVTVPHPAEPGRLKAYKISKRFDQDISAVCAGIDIAVADGVVTGARIAFGGMAATPRRAPRAEAALTGQPWTRATVDAWRWPP